MRGFAQSQFQALLESAPDGVLLADEGGRIILVNRRVEELFGYDRTDLVGRRVELLVPERFRGGHVHHRARYAKDPLTREMGVGLELYGLRKDGTEFPVEISLSPMHVGKRTLVTTTIRDVSDRRAAELQRLQLAREQAVLAEARAARERLETILSDIDAVVWESEAPDRRRFTFVSQKAVDLLGYPIDRWTGEDSFWERIIHDEDRQATILYFQEAHARGAPHELEYRVIAADERVVRVRDIVRAGRAEGQPAALRGVMVDVTERRELEARLLQSQKMNAIGQLAGGVAHDFNNLLTIITGFANLVAARVEDEEAQREVAEILKAADQAADLTGRLLAFSRRAPRSDELVNANELVRGIERMLGRLIDEDIRLQIRTGDGIDLIRIDPTRLEQVLVNLVVNARDAMPGGGTIRIETTGVDLGPEEARERGLNPGRYVAIVVSDTGVGMSPHVLKHIFEPFFTTKPPGKGTGLGLATVYGVVEQAGGTVRAESEAERGSDFVVYLPSAGEAAAPEPAVVGRRDGQRVLLVEDEQAVRLLAKTILEREGYRVLEARNGREALELVEDDAEVDLLITDVVMPELSGPELVSRLSELRPELRVVFMSGYADSRLARRGVGAGARLLRKPFAPDELVAEVAGVLASPPAE